MGSSNHDFRPTVEHKVLSTLIFGSHMYGTNNGNSDNDYVLIAQANERLEYNTVDDKGNDCIVYDVDSFADAIADMKMQAVEVALYNGVLKRVIVDLEKLRREVSSIASNSYVKCKKKLADGEDYIGLKSLFHSLRILMFGTQIARFGKIIDWQCANEYYDEIFAIGADWDSLHKRFKPVYNQLKSEFKKYAPLPLEG